MVICAAYIGILNRHQTNEGALRASEFKFIKTKRAVCSLAVLRERNARDCISVRIVQNRNIIAKIERVRGERMVPIRDG